MITIVVAGAFVLCGGIAYLLLSKVLKIKGVLALVLVVPLTLGIAFVAGTFAKNMGAKTAAHFKEEKVQLTKRMMREILLDLEKYNVACGHFPPANLGLMALSEVNDCPSWNAISSYKRAKRDSWGMDYIYHSDGKTVDLISLGEDRKPGGDNFNKDIAKTDL
jgi:hypothetical protein